MARRTPVDERIIELTKGMNAVTGPTHALARLVEDASEFANEVIKFLSKGETPHEEAEDLIEYATVFALPERPVDELVLMLAASDPEGCDDEWSYEPQAELFRAELKKRGLKLALVSES